MSGRAEPAERGASGWAAVVLAAGRSSRMGSPKALLEVGGEAMVRRVARVAVEAGLVPVVLVVPRGGDYAPALAGLADLELAPADPAGRPGDSLRTGLAALPSGCGGAALLLADMPFVTAALLRKLVAGGRLAAFDHGGEPGPPWAIPRALFGSLVAGSGGRPLQALARRGVAILGAPEGALSDVDTPGDYAWARARLMAARPTPAGFP